jgi:RNA polymerase sigma-70 factor (ECF subfamily)
VDELDLETYHPFHATRADLLWRLGRRDEAAAAYERAAALATTEAERDFLRRGGRTSR